jgi:dTDP-4-dehydrorhamnose reductase
VASTKVLLTGAAGMVGRTLHERLPEHARIVALQHRTPVPPRRRDDRVLRIDLAALPPLRAAVLEERPDVILHCGAISSLGACRSDPHRAHLVNVVATRVLAEVAAERRAYLVFCSTDQVFDGRTAPYGEADRPRPLSAYGEGKVAAEEAVRAAGGEALILRLALVLGRSPGRDRGAVDMLRPAAGVTAPIGLFEDEWRTPVSILDLVRWIGAAIDQRPVGTLHAGGAERIDRLSLGRRICRAFGWPEGRLRAARRADLELPRPEDVSLRLDGIAAHGLTAPLPLDDALTELVESADRGV